MSRPDINSDEFSSNSKFYFDEEKCNWVTEKMVVTNDSIKICKMPGYSFFERDVFCYDNYNPYNDIGGNCREYVF